VARSPRHPTVTAIRLMAMVMAVMATPLMATAMAAVTAIRLTAMAAVTAIHLTATATVITGVTEPPITPLSDATSMPPLPVSIIIVTGTNARHVRALGQPWTVHPPAGPSSPSLIDVKNASGPTSALTSRYL